MPETSALPDLLRRAGAVMTTRGGHGVPAHFGSAAGELAVCVRSVGLAVRSDLASLSLRAEPGALDRIAERALDRPLAAGGALLVGSAWWCRGARADELVVVCRAGETARVARTLDAHASRFSTSEVTDRSRDLTVLSVVGRLTGRVLRELGVFGADGDPHRVSPFSATQLAGEPAAWLLTAHKLALVLVPSSGAAAAWRAIDLAGRDYGISCVGIDSIERYLLLERGSPMLMGTQGCSGSEERLSW